MAGLMQDRFREHISVAEVLKANYGSTDDIERVEAIHALESDIERLCCSREADVQTTLRGGSPSCSVVWACLPVWPLSALLLYFTYADNRHNTRADSCCCCLSQACVGRQRLSRLS